MSSDDRARDEQARDQRTETQASRPTAGFGDAVPGRGSRVRASDAERESVAETIRTAVTDGRLNLEEGDERLAALYATKYRDELGPLTVDLPRPDDGRPGWGPDGRGRPGSWGPPGPWSPGPWGFRRPPWAWPLLPIIAIVAIFGMIGAAAHGHFFWPIIPLLVIFAAVRIGMHMAWRRYHRMTR